MGQFVYVIRKRIKLSPEKAIFIFVDEVLPPTAALMSSIYEEHKDEDGFLYITYVFKPPSHALVYFEVLPTFGPPSVTYYGTQRRENISLMHFN